MREGHDGSGVGLFMRGLSGDFQGLGDYPILSGIFTQKGLEILDEYMRRAGFIQQARFDLEPSNNPPPGVPRRDAYVIRAYKPGEDWDDLDPKERELRMLRVRLDLREADQCREDITIYSFWPDSVMIKEIGDPLKVADHLGLDKAGLKSRIVLGQGRQNTNYAINLYACHPFFIQGVCTMTNGENTAFVPIRDYLMGLGVPGYVGYNSDSEVFTHILHYTLNRLGLSLDWYKHVITPLQDEDIKSHPNADYLNRLKQTCRRLIIDGPNCVIGCTPDNQVFMVQDRKKLRPGIAGGKSGAWAFSSEVCGLDPAVPDRDPAQDFQPMHLDTVYVNENCQELHRCRQTESLTLPH
jgi:glutamate synthase domain-containing protein 1